MNKIEPTEERLDEIEQVLVDIIEALCDIKDAWQEEKKKNKGYLENSYQHVGRIINCHLIIENLVNTELTVLGKANSARFKRNGLTFSQKVKMLPTKGFLYCFLIPGIVNINDIRNHLVHNLKAEIKESDMRLINRYLQIFRKSMPKNLSIEERLEEYTKLCITAFTLKSPAVLQHLKTLSNKYPSLQQMINDVADELSA